MATHSSILAWKIPRTEEPGRLQCMGSQWVGQESYKYRKNAETHQSLKQNKNSIQDSSFVFVYKSMGFRVSPLAMLQSP